MYLILVILPLLSIITLNRWNGHQGGPILSIVSMGFLMILGFIAYYEVILQGSPVNIELPKWFDTIDYQVGWTFRYDGLGVSMFIPILLISALVQVYSYGYLEGDAHLGRFYVYLNLFTLFMVILVTSENLVLIYLSWEGVGLISYLLIHYWNTRLIANFASFKALFINKVGDIGVILGIILIYQTTQDASLATLYSLGSELNVDYITLLTIGIIIAMMAKSAQLGLHTWLTSAMEAPTPISALLHSATMVTAGVFLLLRFSPIMEYTTDGLLIVLIIGAISSLSGAMAGLVETDIKKIIAFSTISQIGYMVVAAGMSYYSLSLFHLMNHALFKSLLFLSSGAIIHALMDEQDVRKMGNLSRRLPITTVSIIIGSLSLMAFPFLTGFYSKEVILEYLLYPTNLTHSISYLLTIIAATMTSLYSIQLFMKTLIGVPHYGEELERQREESHGSALKESGWCMTLPMILLGIGSIIFGYLTHQCILEGGIYLGSITNLGMGQQDGSQGISSAQLIIEANEYQTLIKWIPVGLIGLLVLINPFRINKLSKEQTQNEAPRGTQKNAPGIAGITGIQQTIWNRESSQPRQGSLLHIPQILLQLNHWNHYINRSIILVIQGTSIILRYMDRGLLAISLGPVGLYRWMHYQSNMIEILSTGLIQDYAYYTILTIMLSLMIVIIV